MRTNVLRWAKRMARAGATIAALGLLMGVEDNNGCTPSAGSEAECSAASDCSGVPDMDCTGAWACQAGECVFECGAQPPTGCYGDEDCGETQVCNAHEVCLPPPGCEPGAPCPTVCYGYCVDPPPAATGCYGDQDCKDGERCNAPEVCLPPPGCGPDQICPAVCYGECVAATPPPPAGCYGDQDCEDGERCNAHEVCLPPPGCEAGQACPTVCYGQCVSAAPPPAGCYSDDGCEPGTHCSVSDGDCQSPPGCAPGQPCPDVCYGRCVPDDTTCWSDWDCGPGEQCNTWDHCYTPGCDAGNCLIACQGVCEAKPPSGCQSDADCAAHEYCGCGGGPGMPNGLWCNLMCMPKHHECSSDADCPSGRCELQVCEGGAPACGADGSCDADEAFWPGQCYGYCAPEPPKWDCTSHSDCASGVCDFVVCEVSSDPAFAPCDPSGQSCMPPQPGQCYGYCKPPGDAGECSADSDCGPDEHCQLGPCPLGPCWFDEATGESHCPECFGQCVANLTSGCQSDAECAFGEQCAKECVTACPGCLPNEPCPPCWTDCYGVCKPAHVCGPNGICPDGTACQCVGSCPECDDCAYAICKDEPPAPNGCMVTGCSGQVCAAEPVATTCEYLPWYACYQLANCTQFASGACGWEATDAFTHCMLNLGGAPPP